MVFYRHRTNVPGLQLVQNLLWRYVNVDGETTLGIDISYLLKLKEIR